MNKNNIVVHASDLPKGRGFSPMSWQILEGKNKIKLSEKILFAVEDKLNELMRSNNDEDTRFSGTLSLYNVLL